MGTVNAEVLRRERHLAAIEDVANRASSVPMDDYSGTRSELYEEWLALMDEAVLRGWL